MHAKPGGGEGGVSSEAESELHRREEGTVCRRFGCSGTGCKAAGRVQRKARVALTRNEGDGCDRSADGSAADRRRDDGSENVEDNAFTVEGAAIT
ncbi:hypothetical protein PIB30_035429 [Stylosanthes scabra]|uniref:Uncharacterized protein n=1 Tax=Stylosanthes scabra TaxID=79078 RepID=A0ABU6SCY3_9FABA|nr:hypothetical protein [Stylosanthes scabra]